MTIRRSFAEDFVLGVGAALQQRTKSPGQADDGTLNDARARGTVRAIVRGHPARGVITSAIR